MQRFEIVAICAPDEYPYYIYTISNLYIDQGSDFSAIVTLKNQDGSNINFLNQ